MQKPTPWHQSGFEQLEVPLIIVGADRHIAYANPAARRLFGTVPGTLEGAGIDRLVVNERRGELRNIEDVLKGGSARRVRSIVRRDDGGRLDVTMSVEPCLDAAGRVEAATVRYELIAASGRMSAAPDARGDSRQPGFRSAPTSSMPLRGGITDESGSHLSAAALSARQAPTVRPAPTVSGPYQAGSAVGGEFEARLAQLAGNLAWLEERLTLAPERVSLDDSRERAKVLLVVAEARAQLRQVMDEAKQHQVSVPPLPAPPKLPSL
ncbi:MAG: PAS domain-containing protein [Myxococcales bacterium]